MHKTNWKEQGIHLDCIYSALQCSTLTNHIYHKPYCNFGWGFIQQTDTKQLTCNKQLAQAFCWCVSKRFPQVQSTISVHCSVQCSQSKWLTISSQTWLYVCLAERWMCRFFMDCPVILSILSQLREKKTWHIATVTIFQHENRVLRALWYVY